MKKRHRAVVSAALLALSMAGLATVALASIKLQLGHSAEIPAAQGELKVRDTHNGNIGLKLSVRHLAPPGRVVSGASLYVVWVRGLTPGTDAQNLGLLKVSRNLSGKFVGVTPVQSFDLFLTCEQSATALVPSAPELLSVQYLHK